MNIKIKPEKIAMGFHYTCGCRNEQVFTDSTNLEISGTPICPFCNRGMDADYYWEISEDGIVKEKEMTLEDWYIHPVLPGRIEGKIFNDVKGRFNDGDEIMTSRVWKIENGYAFTKYGSKYKLGSPNKSLFGITEDGITAE